jgi:soluble lytic murein transglycosylase-like protein
MALRIILAALLLSASRAYAQQADGEQVKHVIEEVHRRVSDAANAANSVLKADQHRSQADRLAAAGEHEQARTELQAAAELIDRDQALQFDPLLQDYVSRLRDAINRIDGIKQSAQAASPHEFESHPDWLTIERVLKANALPARLAAIVMVESAGDPTALSPKGARGLWQLMPDTARRYGLRVDDNIDDRIDPLKSTLAAVQYLRDLFDMFHDWPLALAAYNAGENRIQNVMERTGIRRFTEMAEKRLLPSETIQYVPTVMNLMMR